MTNSSEYIIDQLLVMDAQDGDVKAMEKLVCRWQKRLWQYVSRLTSDSQAAWDITQQAWLGIIKGLRKLRDPANFKAWAYGITTNKSIDWKKNVKLINISVSRKFKSINTRRKKTLALKSFCKSWI